jgi:hypothetical protein
VNSSYQKIRELIARDIYSIVKLPEKIFHDAIVETIILSFKNNFNINKIMAIRYSNTDIVDKIDLNLSYRINKDLWFSLNPLKFNIYLTADYQRIIKKCHEESCQLGNIADFTLGITPYDKYKGHSKKTIENREFHSKEKIDESYKPLIEGANITPYFVKEKCKEFIKYGDWLGAPREKRFFIEPRIIVRQIVSGNPPKIYAAYTEKELYFTQIGFAIIPKEDIAPKVLITLLNSKLINFIHKFLYLDIEKKLFQKVLIENCKKFPIKIDNIQNLSSEIIKIVDKIIERKQQSPDTDTSDLEAEIDQIIYHIYGLTEEEIKIVEGDL